MPGPIQSWSTTDKIKEAIVRSKKFMPAALGAQLDAFFTPTNLALMAGTIALWAGSQFFGVGEIVDVGLLLVGAFTVGWSITNVLDSLVDFGTTAVNACTDGDLDDAARSFASALVTAGVTAVMAILLRRSAKEISLSRGANIADAARPRSPGLARVPPDPDPAGPPFRTPTVTGDPTRAPGTGATNAFGDVQYSTAGTATDQQLVRFHELVHSKLSPRFRPLRVFRARLRMSAYSRSVLMKYLEEALAETFAQLGVNGARGILTGIRFPVCNGYMSLQQLACEGAEIGTIAFGTQRFSVQFIPGSPAAAHPSP